jgi:hypothetical protein
VPAEIAMRGDDIESLSLNAWGMEELMVKLTRTEGETPPCVTETEESSRSSSVISSQDGHN